MDNQQHHVDQRNLCTGIALRLQDFVSELGKSSDTAYYHI